MAVGIVLFEWFGTLSGPLKSTVVQDRKAGLRLWLLFILHCVHLAVEVHSCYLGYVGLGCTGP